LKKLANRFRIGEKIILGFGAVGLIFLGVIWHYHTNLRDMTDAYRDLSAVYGARQARAFAIESHVASMRAAADRFLLTRDLAFAEQTLAQAKELRAQADALAREDDASARTAAAIRGLADEFANRFAAIVEAWRIRGLDEDSGLQGAFRDAVHELEARAGHYNVDRLYLLLLQVRRGEKDLGLRREARYRERVNGLLDEMQTEVATSTLRDDTKRALDAEIDAYRERFARYADEVLAGEPTGGGKGPFRDRAHRIEDLLQAHYIPDLESAVLQMRRREKDYLLRGDQQYIDMVDAIADDIAARVAASSVAADQQAALVALLDNYRRDFHALVDQNDRIARLTSEMYEDAARINPLVEGNLAEASATMAQKTAEIADSSAQRSRWSLLVAGIAPLLGLLLAIVITSRIVRPVQRMVGLLDRLTREVPRERLDTDPTGRDEINAMAIALNTLADHRARFSEWWRSSMQAAVACRDLGDMTDADERIEAALELRKAASARLAQLDAERARMLDEAGRLETLATRQPRGARGRAGAVELRGIAGNLRTFARLIQGN
jgi:methyl-accepting chemotaxis protein